MTKNWTTLDGISNASPLFFHIVAAVDAVLRDHRLGTDTTTTARLIVAQLAHKHHFGPIDTDTEPTS